MSSTIKIERICGFCGDSFTAKTTVTQFCSHKCSSRAYKARKRTEKINTSNTTTYQARVKTEVNISNKEYLSIADVCRLLGVARQTVYNLINRGELEMGKFGGRTIIRKSNIDNLLNKYSEPLRRDTSSNEYYTIKEVEELYNIKYGRLYEIVKKYKIPKRLYKNKLHISKPHVDKYFTKTRGDINNIKDWYTVDELTTKYRLSRDSVYRIVSEKSIPKKREGRYVYISKWHFDNLELIEPPKTTTI